MMYNRKTKFNIIERFQIGLAILATYLDEMRKELETYNEAELAILEQIENLTVDANDDNKFKELCDEISRIRKEKRKIWDNTIEVCTNKMLESMGYKLINM